MGSVTELCGVIGWNSRVCRLDEGWVGRGGEGRGVTYTVHFATADLRCVQPPPRPLLPGWVT